MALDPRKRQKKAERRKAKQKSRAVANRTRTQQMEARLRESIQVAPILHSFISDNL